MSCVGFACSRVPEGPRARFSLPLSLLGTDSSPRSGTSRTLALRARAHRYVGPQRSVGPQHCVRTTPALIYVGPQDYVGVIVLHNARHFLWR